MNSKIIDTQAVRFVIVGVINTVVGMSVMFVSYNVFRLGYSLSTALNYIVGSIVSYFLNKYFTFKSEKKSVKEIAKFVLNIVICYFLSYGLARRLIGMIVSSAISKTVADNISMLCGSVFFVFFNFFGQKFFVFNK